MRTRLSTILVVVAGAVSGLIGCSPPPVAAPPPLQVPVVEVLEQDVPILTEAVGQTVGSLDLSIRARVDGVLESIEFQEGTSVEKDQVLYRIDPDALEAQVDETRGKLAEARARRVRADADLMRIKPLVAMDALSQRTLDQAQAEFEAAVGLFDSATATLERAQIELGYSIISSPIDGLIGVSLAYVGDYVGRYPNPVVLNTVSLIDPIGVRFSISEKEYLELARKVLERKKLGDTTLDKAIAEKRVEQEFELFLADGTLHPHRGTLNFADRTINPDTGTLLLEARFPNPDKLIRPGQFARVRAVVDTLKDALLVPQRAVRELQGTYQVFVVDGQGQIEVRSVEPGPRVGQLWVITKGLNRGEKVAVENLQRLRPGLTVAPVPISIEPQDAKKAAAGSRPAPRGA